MESSALTYTCNYDESAGEGVDIYIVGKFAVFRKMKYETY